MNICISFTACIVMVTNKGWTWTSLCQYTLAWKGKSMLHPSPVQPELSDIFTVKVMILDTRNGGDPAWSVDSGISLMNWTRKPCWHKEEGFRLGVTTPDVKNTSLLSQHAGLAGWERDRRDRQGGSSAGLDATTAAAAAEATGSWLIAGWPLSAKRLFW